MDQAQGGERERTPGCDEGRLASRHTNNKLIPSRAILARPRTPSSLAPEFQLVSDAG